MTTKSAVRTGDREFLASKLSDKESILSFISKHLEYEMPMSMNRNVRFVEPQDLGLLYQAQMELPRIKQPLLDTSQESSLSLEGKEYKRRHTNTDVKETDISLEREIYNPKPVPIFDYTESIYDSNRDIKYA